MKTILVLLVMLASSPAYAELFKCKINGKTTYQEKPCKGEGSEFILKRDISPEQQQAAKEKLEAELAERAEQKQLEQETATQRPQNTMVIPGQAQPAPEPDNPSIQMIYTSPGTLK